MDYNHDLLRRSTADAIRKAHAEMEAEFGTDPLHGFALCTDDDVTTLFSAACTKSWVAKREADYEAIGYIYTEWEQGSGDSHFNAISDTVAELATDEHSTVQRRFEAFVLALEDCRNDGLFDPETLLCCGSTDPYDEMEMLAMRAVDRLNSTAKADMFAKHLGYEEHREEGG